MVLQEYTKCGVFNPLLQQVMSRSVAAFRQNEAFFPVDRRFKRIIS